MTAQYLFSFTTAQSAFIGVWRFVRNGQRAGTFSQAAAILLAILLLMVLVRPAAAQTNVSFGTATVTAANYTSLILDTGTQVVADALNDSSPPNVNGVQFSSVSLSGLSNGSAGAGFGVASLNTLFSHSQYGGSATDTVTGLIPGDVYRAQFFGLNENTNPRLFNVSVGTATYSNWNVYFNTSSSTAGALLTANFTATSTSTTLAFYSSNNNIQLCGFDVFNLGPASATVLAWTGSGTSMWSDSTSWTPAGAPTTSGTNLLTFAGSLGLSNTNNLTGLNVASMTFVTSAGAFTLSGNSISLSGPVTNNSTNLQTIGLNMAISGSGQTFAPTSGGIFVSGAVSGTGGITVNGSGGMVTLSGSNTYSGGSIINSGELSISSDANIGGGTSAITFNGGLLQVTGTSLTTLGSHVINASTFNGGFDIATAGNTYVVPVSLSGSGSLTKIGAGTLSLTASNTLTGSTNVSAGTLNVGHVLALQNSTVNVNGGGLTFSQGITAPTFGGLSGSGGITLNTAAAENVALSVGANNQNSNFSGVLSGGGGLTKVGTGKLTLSAQNTYAGATTIGGGIVALGTVTSPWTIQSVTSPANIANTGTLVTANCLNDSGVTVNGVPFASTSLSGLSNGGFSSANLGNSSINQLFNDSQYGSSASYSVSGLIPGDVYRVQFFGYTPNSNPRSFNVSVGTSTYMGWNTYTGTSGTIATLLQDVWTQPQGSTTTTLSFTSGAQQVQFCGFDVFNTTGIYTSAGNSFISNLGSLPTTTPVNLTVSGAGLDLVSTNQTIGSLSGVAGAVVYLGGGTLTVGGNNASTTFAGSISDLGGAGTVTGGCLITTGTGTLTLSGSNSYSGGTSITSGVLQLGNAAALGSSTSFLTVNGALDLNGYSASVGSLGGGGVIDNVVGGGTPTLTVGNGNASGVFSGIIQNTSGTMALVKTGSGALVLSGPNTYAGGTTISSGVLQFANTTSMPSSGTVNVASGAILVVNSGGPNSEFSNLSTPVAGSIGGLLAGIGGQGGGVSFSAGASLGIDTTNAYEGLTYGGTIADFNGNMLGLVKLGGNMLTLSGSNTYSGGTTVSGGILQVGSPTALGNSSVLVMNGGVLDLNGFSLTVGSLSGNSGGVTNNSSSAVLTIGSGSYGGVLSDGIGTLGVTVSGGALTLSGSNANQFSGGLTILTGGSVVFSNDSQLGIAGGSISLNGGSLKGVQSATITIGATRTITLGNSQGSGGGFFDAGGSSTLLIASQLSGSGFAAFNYEVGGVYVLSNSNNNYTGNTGIGAQGPGYSNSGSAQADLKMGAVNALPFGPGNGNVIVGYTPNDIVYSASTLDLAGYNTSMNGLTTNNPAYSYVTNSSTAAVALTFGYNNASATFGGTIGNTGGALSLIKTGSGTQNLSGANSFTGATTVNGGVLQMGNGAALGSSSLVTVAAGSLLDINGYSLTLASLAGGGVIDNVAGGGAPILTVSSGTFSGTIQNTSGSTSLAMAGTGILVLGGTNTYDGGTVLNSGELSISSDANIGGGTSAITFNGGLLQVTGTSLTTLGSHVINASTFNGGFDIATAGNTYVVPVSLSGSGSLTKIGAGTLSLTASNTLTGSTNVSAGTLNVGHVLALQNSTVNVNGGGLTFSQGITAPTFGGLSGSGGITLNTAAAENVALSVGANNQNSNFSGVLSGGGGLTKVGTGNLILTGASNYASATTISGGLVSLGVLGVAAPIWSIQSVTSTANIATTGTLVTANCIHDSGVTVNGIAFTSTTLPGLSSGGFTNANLGNSSINQLFDDSQYGSVPSTSSSYGLTGLIPGDTYRAQFFAYNNNTPPYRYFNVTVDGSTSPNWNVYCTSGNTAALLQAVWTQPAGGTTMNLVFAGNVNFLGDLGAVQLSGFDVFNITAQVSSLAASGSLPATSPVNITASGSGIDLASTNQTIASLSGVAGSILTLGGGTLSVGANNANTTFAGTISDLGGVISQTGGSLIKAGAGTLKLTGSNAYSSATIVNAGALQATDGVGLPSSSNLVLGGSLAANGVGAVLQSSGSFTRTIGTNPGQVQWTSDGGFAANGGPLFVSMFPGLSLMWGNSATSTGTPGFLGQNNVLTFGSDTANNQVNFTDSIDTNGAVRQIDVQSGVGGSALISGNIIDSTQSGGGLLKTGAGVLILSASNTYAGGTTVEGGTLVLDGASSLLAGSSLTIGGGGSPGAVFAAPQSAASANVAPVPEPRTFTLLAVGGLLILAYHNRLRKISAQH